MAKKDKTTLLVKSLTKSFYPFWPPLYALFCPYLKSVRHVRFLWLNGLDTHRTRFFNAKDLRIGSLLPMTRLPMRTMRVYPRDCTIGWMSQKIYMPSKKRPVFKGYIRWTETIWTTIFRRVDFWKSVHSVSFWLALCTFPDMGKPAACCSMKGSMFRFS